MDLISCTRADLECWSLWCVVVCINNFVASCSGILVLDGMYIGEASHVNSVHVTKMEALRPIVLCRNFPLKMQTRSATTLKTLQRVRQQRGTCVRWYVQCTQWPRGPPRHRYWRVEVGPVNLFYISSPGPNLQWGPAGRLTPTCGVHPSCCIYCYCHFIPFVHPTAHDLCVSHFIAYCYSIEY